MEPSVHIDGGGGDTMLLTIILWSIRIFLPLAAAAMWLKLSSPDGKAPVSSTRVRGGGLFDFIWQVKPRSYTVAQIVQYRDSASIPSERPLSLPTLAPQDRRNLGRKTESYQASPTGGLLTAPGAGEDREGPRAGTFRNGARVSLRKETNPLRHDHWLPTVDASQLGIAPQTAAGANGLMTSCPIEKNILGGEGLQIHGGGLISAAAYQKMKTTRRALGNDDAPSYTTSPTPYSAQTLSLQQALGAAFTNSVGPDVGQATKQQMSALRSLTPLLNQTREALFESPALQPPHPRPHTAVVQGAASPGHENTTHHVNTTSPPIIGEAFDYSPPSFITANRDAVIELRKLLSTPCLEKAQIVLRRLRDQGISIAPQTYTLLVTVALLCGCKDFASRCAKEMADDGYKLSDALHAKLHEMGATRNQQYFTASAAMATLRASDVNANNDGSSTKLTATAPVFTPCAIGATSSSGQRVDSSTSGPRDGASAENSMTGPAWLLPAQHASNGMHTQTANGGLSQHVDGTRVVHITHRQQQQHQQGPLAWLPPQHGRTQQGDNCSSPPMPDNSPPPSDMLPHRRPVGHSAPSSPLEQQATPQRPTPVDNRGGAVHFHKAVSQLGAKGSGRTPDSNGKGATRRPKSAWRKKTDAT